MIVIEGCDKTGKSTLAKNLSDDLGIEVVKFNKPKTGNPYEEYVEFLINLNKDVILDRFNVGEFVYPLVFNRTTMMTRRHLRTVEMMLECLGATVVHARTDPGFIKGKFIEDQENLNTVSDVEFTVGLYDIYFNHVSFHDWVPFDIQRPNKSISVIKKRFTNTVGSFPFETRKMLLDSGYQGFINHPEVLFVGEISNDNGRKRRFPRPFDLSASSDVLFRLIRNTGTKRFGIINSLLQNGDPVDVGHVCETVKPRILISLGQSSGVNVMSFDLGGIPHFKMTHPGYVRRFMNIRTSQSMFESEFEEITKCVVSQ